MTEKYREKALIIGGGSGIGLATARLAAEKGYEVIIAGRNVEKLQSAKQSIAKPIKTIPMDMLDQESIRVVFETLGKIDHLVIAASEITFGDVRTLSVDSAKASFDSKLFGPYRLVQVALDYLNKTGSITLFSGSAGAKPEVGTEVISAINAAVEGFSRGLAVSYAPLRVNTVSPGLIDTPLYDTFDPAVKDQFFNKFTQTLKIPRAGKAEEVAEAVLFLMGNGYTTGMTLFVDGGHRLS